MSGGLRTIVALSVGVVVGCSDKHGTAVVTGTVRYKSQPVEGASISFLPKSDDAKSKAAHGRTDAGGRFTLTTYFSPDDQPAGALPGEYSVTVTKIDEPVGAYDPHKDPLLKNHLPSKYSTPQKTPLTAIIKTGTNRPEFNLED
jgi:hypothetical protein